MGGDNTCKACFADCTATCKGAFREADTNGGYSKKLLTDCCADPGLAFYSCLCPCLLQGQISQAQGRNCCSACVCTIGPCIASSVPVVGMCCYCSTCCYDIPDRMDFGKQNYLEACFSVSCCCNVPGRVQLAQQLGVKPWNFEEIKRDTSASGETFKSDVMLRNLLVAFANATSRVYQLQHYTRANNSALLAKSARGLRSDARAHDAPLGDGQPVLD